MNEELTNAPWHLCDIYNTIGDQCDYWKSLLESILNKYAPIKKKRVRETDIPYMTAEWKKPKRNKKEICETIFQRSVTRELRTQKKI